jgi:hypothetical protein
MASRQKQRGGPSPWSAGWAYESVRQGSAAGTVKSSSSNGDTRAASPWSLCPVTTDEPGFTKSHLGQKGTADQRLASSRGRVQQRHVTIDVQASNT